MKVWEISHFNFGELLLEELRECEDDSYILDFADKDNGSILTVRMVEETMGKGSKPFLKAKRIDFDERDEPLSKDILEQAVAFDTALVINSYEQLNAMFYDLEDEEEPEGAEDALRAERAAKRNKRNDDEDEKESKRDKKRREKDDDGEDEKEDRRKRRGKEDSDPDDEKKDRGKGKSKREKDDDDQEDEKTSRRNSRKDEPEDDDPPLPKRGNKKESREKDEDGEDDEKYDKPKGGKKGGSDDLECPEGGVFGEDCDSEELYDKCEECNLWQECRDAADAALAAKKKNRK